MSIEQEIKGIIDNAMALNKQEQKDFTMKVQEQFNEISQQMNKLGQIISGTASDTPKRSLQDDRSEMLLVVSDDGYSIKAGSQFASYRPDGSMAFNWGNKEGPQLPTCLKFKDYRSKKSVDNESDSIESSQLESGSLKTTSVDIHIVDGKGQMTCRMERPSDHELSEKIKELKAYDVDAQLMFVAALMPTELLKSI
ncbi:hypothetical protein SAMN05216522_10222 [Rosenbergiella nectarea]|uniref:Uncharacterized protein n=1 Tax=Rosenbergiella nectarea TaxID=988801 RepID=A0A1H9ESA6_9GAMM|nr:hypothetical protein [Rosenbergiella nectarea]SEQ27888.1 hypothetical protein SAMN05216522_10222 [Rosenbergiella nectarea]